MQWMTSVTLGKKIRQQVTHCKAHVYDLSRSETEPLCNVPDQRTLAGASIYNLKRLSFVILELLSLEDVLESIFVLFRAYLEPWMWFLRTMP